MTLRDHRSGLGAGPSRWQKATEAHDRARQQRDRAIKTAYHQRRGTAREIADAYGITPEWVYQIAGKREEPAD